MKVVILAGGYGTRLSEETAVRPKPMVEIGGRPLLWHIMRHYAHYGLTDFIVCCGYRGDVIRDYFDRYDVHNSTDVTYDLATGEVEIHRKESPPWRVTLVDTGDGTQTGGRLLRIADYVDGDFAMTYGDGIGDVNIRELLKHHSDYGKKATVTAVRPPLQFGALQTKAGGVIRFQEKPRNGGSRISGGFFILSPDVFDYITDDQTVWEKEPMERLTRDNQLSAYHHDGFWAAMDTLSDRHTLEALWATGNAPWKVW